MRRVISAAMSILAAACGNVLVPAKNVQPEQPQGAPGPITITAARFGGHCKTPSDDVTELFRQACDGKWRCAVRSSPQLSAKHKAIEEAALACGGAKYFVDWTCGKSVGKRSLTGTEGSRFRLSCPRPDGENDEALAVTLRQAEDPLAPETVARSGPSRESATAIHGRFLSSTASIADRKIVAGGRQTSTDQAGTFSVSGVARTYDLSVVDSDGARVTLFLGLSRRDPVVAHPQRQGGDLPRGAVVRGRLAGPPLTKADGRLRATIQFFSAQRPLPLGDAGFLNRVRYPGDIDQNPVSWRGPPTISGRLLATIYSEDGDDYPLVGIASKTLALEAGDTAFEDLTAVRLPQGHIAGTWSPAENPQVTSLSVSYELGDGSGEFWVGACRLRDSAGAAIPSSQAHPPAPGAAQPFDCPIPDLGLLPGRYRVFLLENSKTLEPEEAHLSTCNTQTGSVSLATPCTQGRSAAPGAATTAQTVQFTSPSPGQLTEITSDSRFAWEPRKDSVYAIDLVPNETFNLVPRVSIFTRKTSFRWRDLASLGIGFPTGALYVASVISIPVASVDTVASLDWWYGRAADEQGPETKESGLKLVDSTAVGSNLPGPSNVKDLNGFPSGLPACVAEMKGEVLGSNSFGKTVTITGNLRRTLGECLDDLTHEFQAANCSHYWAITDVPGSSRPISLGRLARDGIGPPVPVAATGRLVLDGDRPMLEHANVCLIQAEP